MIIWDAYEHMTCVAPLSCGRDPSPSTSRKKSAYLKNVAPLSCGGDPSPSTSRKQISKFDKNTDFCSRARLRELEIARDLSHELRDGLLVVAALEMSSVALLRAEL